MFNLILNNLVETAKTREFDVAYNIHVNPKNNPYMGGIAKVYIDKFGTIHNIEFLSIHLDGNGSEHKGSEKHISKKNFCEMLEESYSINTSMI